MRAGRSLQWLLLALLPFATSAVAREPTGAIARPVPEERLLEVLNEIQASRPDIALEKVTALTHENPKFRLAQLVQADLLHAMAAPLHGIGSPLNGTRGAAVDGLRDEARVRWQRQATLPPAGHLPASLIKLGENQRHAIVVDLSVSRLYLYENRDGEIRLIGDYYTSQGSNGAAKQKEGDRRTPVGVYRIVSHIPKEKLTDLYGDGAYPVDYPNEWDRRLSRTGHGIWLHGNPTDTYSRAPRSSEGCVTVPNEDLHAIARHIDIGRTPAIFADHIEWLPAAEVKRRREEITGALERWRRDWESRDSARYLGHYSKDFRADGKDYAAWAGHKQRVNADKDFIRVGIDDLSIFRYPGVEGDMVVVDFRQDYRSSNFSGTSGKRQFWRKEADGVWRIIYEG